MQSKERELTSACAVYGEVRIIINCLMTFRKEWVQNQGDFADEYGWCNTTESKNRTLFNSGVNFKDAQGVVVRSVTLDQLSYRRYFCLDEEFFSLNELDILIDKYERSLRRITREINSLTASIMEEWNEV